MNTITLLYYILYLLLLIIGILAIVAGTLELQDKEYRDVISKRLKDIMEQVNDD